jgi:FMN-dependent NADH-azoreductase
VISQPGMVFGFDPDRGYSGLLTGRTAVVIYTSAVYGPDVSRDFGVDYQAPYLDEWLRWAGIEQTDTIEFRPNLVTRDTDSKRRAAHVAAVDAAMRLVAEAA